MSFRRIGTEPGPGMRSAASGHEAFDRNVPHIARMYDYWLGGKDNYAADRAVADQIAAIFPDILVGVRAQRAFLGRVVRYLAAEAGIWQFLDIGTGLPSASNTHEVAQRFVPQSRVVYVDNSPVVLAHARALLGSGPQGATAFIQADLRDTGRVLDEAARILDLSQPVAVLLLGVLPFIPDDDDPAAIVARLMAAVPPGSYLAVAHSASDIAAEQMARTVRRYNLQARDPVTVRSYAEVARFFDGLDLVEPGLVQLHRWRAESDGLELPNYGGVGRKP
jgi:O-methyltransferase involved in polyketide biosynthesis